MTLIGTDIESSRRDEFFTWFHLVLVGHMREGAGLDRIDFRPSGESFRALVMLSAWVDADRHIVRLRLSLARRFVSNPLQGSFARDIAKSFLRVTARDSDPAERDDLANEIEFGLAGNAAPVIMSAARAIPSLPQPPTRGYGVYLGAGPSHEIAGDDGRLLIENADDQLNLTVS